MSFLKGNFKKLMINFGLMIDVFKDYLRAKTRLKEFEIERVSNQAAARSLKRNDSLLKQGDICRHKAFIAIGLLRTYGLTPDGNEHILQFASENNWTLDAESYNKGIPSRYMISAVEPSEILLWAKPDFDELLLSIPELKIFSDNIISDTVHNTRDRLLTVLSASPEEKYEEFLRNTPQLLQRLPLKMIAAYLGISLKTLNRVRQAQLQRT